MDMGKSGDKRYVTQVMEEITGGNSIAEYCEEIKNNKLCILSGVGSGKSVWVKEYLAEQGRVLFVTSRRAKVDQDSNTSNFTTNIKKGLRTGKLLLTNAGLAHWISNIDTLYYKKENSNLDIDLFLEYFDYLVFDEIHSLYTDATFAKTAMQIFDFIDYAMQRGKIIIGMTGTEYPISAYLSYFKWNVIDLRKECNSVLPAEIEVISKEQLNSKIAELTGKTVYFSNTAKNIRKNIYPEMVKRFGIGQVAVIQSPDREEMFLEEINLNVEKYIEIEKDINRDIEITPGKVKEIVNEICEDTQKSLINTQLLPEQIKILISTSKLKEGVEIKNEDIDFIFCESLYLTDIIQYYGRIRKSLKKVYIVYDAQQYIIPYNFGEGNYSWHYAVKTINKYIEELDSSEVYIPNEKEEFQSFLDRTHQYIAYSYVYSRYRFFVNRLGGQTVYLRGIKNWKNELRDYCIEYGINLIVPEDFWETEEEKLEKLLQKMKEYEQNNEFIPASEVKILKQEIRAVGKLKNQKVTTINKFLDKYGYMVKEHRKNKSRGWRVWNKWMFLDVDDNELFG